MDSDQGIEIPLPEGFSPPEGTQEGDTFTVLVEAKIKDGTTLCLYKADGIPLKQVQSTEARGTTGSRMYENFKASMP